MMTEQCVSHLTSQDDAWKCNRGASKQEERDYHSDIENMAEEHQKNGRTISEPQQAADHELYSRKKPALVRSKTFDHSMLTQVQTDPDTKTDRKKPQYSQLSKSNCQYHKIFKEISKEEQLRQSYTSALQKDILYQGRMFVSDHWICFHSKVFGKDTKIAIPVMSVTQIKKTKTAILVPNALVIATANDRYVFVSLLSRDNTYKFLMSICLHLEVRQDRPLTWPPTKPLNSDVHKHRVEVRFMDCSIATSTCVSMHNCILRGGVQLATIATMMSFAHRVPVLTTEPLHPLSWHKSCCCSRMFPSFLH
ncbi:GRAM domain-containing 2B [Solea senegalensis]|uniref:GRAM domain-containing 2B n=1 Tax=Solea senegalensis TaxID=28829 RepID=A0AAV6QJ17_SOLSE|nr:GRAM domain-containing 2B [Solea senegalensis]